MFIPIGTDAPLYHRPWATGSLIVLCVGIWIAVTVASSDHLITTLCLEYGHGLKPWQWLTSLFMHAGIIHLLGNMIVLWVFGLVVEGKVGWARFLLIYLSHTAACRASRPAGAAATAGPGRPRPRPAGRSGTATTPGHSRI